MAKIKLDENKIKEITNELIKKYNLDMKVVNCEYGDDHKIIITYICEDRVDFRELVKSLAAQLHYRIELKQIGVRDHAKKVGGIGICGKECCCAQYLDSFDKVSVKMAKNQGLSLNPTKISGVCGRLMCCLSYEDKYYQDMAKIMPKLNSEVCTPDGVGTVVYLDFIGEKVDVKFANDGDVKIVKFSLDELKNMGDKKKDNSHTQANNNEQNLLENNVKTEKENNRHNKKNKFKKHNRNSD